MTTPLATVANSIIEFILSLLRDPAALEELKEEPEATLAKNKLGSVCAEDVRAVAPVIYDRPDVAPRVNPPAPPSNHNDVVNEITRITTNWTMIDNRATIVDQSVNQNIWTEGGDVTQIFDQSAGVASGDGSAAGGDDAIIDNSTNTDTDIDVDGDGNDLGTIPDAVEDTVTGVTDAVTGAEGAEGPLPGGEEIEETDLEALAAEPVDDGIQEPAEQLDAAVDAGVPEPAAEVVETVAQQPAVAEVDEAVWSEPADAAVVEEVVYPEELEEQ
ncbi:IniB N-terminal domain-containing protein [Microbacterium sp. NPDC056569]|uniref:IniB N-terminal domain-containing protein n=1 Tax=Microbacterium sp. NPDC056569 TaxID=3345867 RepID=UPI00366EB132